MKSSYCKKWSIIFLDFMLLVVLADCKSHKQATAAVSQQTSNKPDTNQSQIYKRPKTNGVVSHRYKATGCPTVVITDKVYNGKDTMILVPMRGLDSFDSDGLKISFHYQGLLIKNPPGCEHGYPAILTDITRR